MMKWEIVYTWPFNHAPQVVWEYLTVPELLSQWLMENDFKPVVGHKFRFKAKPKLKIGFDGNIYCEVLEVVPFKRLSYAWRGGPEPGKTLLDSVVTWTLEPTPSGCKLVLQHSGFKGLKNLLPYLIMNKGWLKIGGRLNKLLTRTHETATHA